MTEQRCPSCGWPTAEPYETISRHSTSEGVVVYTRCACGRLSMALYRRPGPAELRAAAATPATTTPATTGPEPCPTR